MMQKSTIHDMLALTIASLYPLGMALLYFVVLDSSTGSANPVFMAAFSGGKVLQFLFPIAYLWWFDRERIRFTAPTWRGIPLAAGFAVIVGMAMFVLYFAVVQHIEVVRDETPGKIFAKVQQFGAATPQGFLLIAVAISCLHSLLEEYYWRWFIYGRLRLHLPTSASIVLSGIGFMLHHIVILGVYFPGNFWLLVMPFALCVGIGGGVWAWIYERSESLYAPWLSHCLIDGAIMGVGYVMLSRFW